MSVDGTLVPDLDKSLGKLRQSQEIDASTLAAFSGLDRPSIEQFVRKVSVLDVVRRRLLVERLAEEAESDIRMDFVDLFFELLSDGDARVREGAINGLWEHDRVQFIRPLAKLLESDPDYGVRAAAAISLGRFLFMAECDELDERRAGLVRDVLREAAEAGPDIEVQRRALESLAYLSEPWVLELVDMAYDHEDERMRQSSLFAMGRTAEPRWRAIVLSELDSAVPAMRYEAVRAAGELALEEAVERLVALTEDLDGQVQEMAIWSLGQIGGKRVKEVLEFLVENGSEAQAEAADAALDELEFATRPMQMFVHDYSDQDLDQPDPDVFEGDYSEEASDGADEDWPDEFLDL